MLRVLLCVVFVVAVGTRGQNTPEQTPPAFGGNCTEMGVGLAAPWTNLGTGAEKLKDDNVELYATTLNLPFTKTLNCSNFLSDFQRNGTLRPSDLIFELEARVYAACEVTSSTRTTSDTVSNELTRDAPLVNSIAERGGRAQGKINLGNSPQDARLQRRAASHCWVDSVQLQLGTTLFPFDPKNLSQTHEWMDFHAKFGQPGVPLSELLSSNYFILKVAVQPGFEGEVWIDAIHYTASYLASSTTTTATSTASTTSTAATTTTSTAATSVTATTVSSTAATTTTAVSSASAAPATSASVATTVTGTTSTGVPNSSGAAITTTTSSTASTQSPSVSTTGVGASLDTGTTTTTVRGTAEEGAGGESSVGGDLLLIVVAAIVAAVVVFLVVGVIVAVRKRGDGSDSDTSVVLEDIAPTAHASVSKPTTEEIHYNTVPESFDTYNTLPQSGTDNYHTFSGSGTDNYNTVPSSANPEAPIYNTFAGNV